MESIHISLKIGSRIFAACFGNPSFKESLRVCDRSVTMVALELPLVSKCVASYHVSGFFDLNFSIPEPLHPEQVPSSTYHYMHRGGHPGSLETIDDVLRCWICVCIAERSAGHWIYLAELLDRWWENQGFSSGSPYLQTLRIGNSACVFAGISPTCRRTQIGGECIYIYIL